MIYGWLLTLPAAALFGAVAAAIALIGPLGVVIVLVALLFGTTTIVAISRRTAVNRHSVNDSRDVTVRIGRGSIRSPVAAGTTHGAAFGSAEWRRGSPDDIGPIVITQVTPPPAGSDSTSSGSPS